MSLTKTDAFTQPYPLSGPQLGIWYEQALSTDPASHNLAELLHIDGAVDVARLITAVEVVVESQEILRFVVIDSDGDPELRIGDNKIDLEVLDFSSVSQPGSEARKWIDSDVRIPFSLKRGPLARFVLIQLGPDKNIFYSKFHHLIIDGASLSAVSRLIASAYSDLKQAENVGLESMLGWDEVVLGEQKYKESVDKHLDREFWIGHCEDTSAPLTLSNRSQSAKNPGRPRLVRIPLPDHVVPGLRRLGKLLPDSRARLWQVLHALLCAYLYRMTGEEDICIAVPRANRADSSLRNLPGMFSNTILPRTYCRPDVTLDELVSSVTSTLISCAKHERYPTHELVRDLGLLSKGITSPAQMSLNYWPFAYDFSFDDAPVENEVISYGPCRDLNFVIQENPHSGATHLILVYPENLYTEAEIFLHGERFLHLLQGAVDHPNSPLSRLPLLPDAEREQLLVQWNDTSVAYPRDQSVHELFEAQVERTPEATALVFEEEELTYGALNARSNQLAHYLQARGVGPETLVGVCLERSLDMVIGLLAILKAGGAYVPLDRTNPSQRLAAQVADASLKVLLSTSDVDTSWAARAQRIDLDAESQAIAEASWENPLPVGNGRSLAYVMYTSGSTGTPKGVEVVHGGLTNYVAWAIEAYGFANLPGALLHSSIAVDLTVTALWPTLCSGGLITIAGDTDGGGLGVFLAEQSDLGLLKLTPTHLGIIDPDSLPAVMQSIGPLIIGGEMLFSEQLSKWGKRFPAARIVNEYGPTESVVGCCSYELPADSSLMGAIPIGCPIANTEVYVLDAHRQPVPIGVAGELYIGGAGLARGYLNRPELTAEKFVPHPFSNEAGARLYRTGDVCRWLADGNLEFMGRLDEQVKLRGYRIELGEIESVLKEHDDVLQCVVMLREDRPGDKRLVAYCVMRAGASLDLVSLRHHAHERLPEYMIPSAFVSLEAFPLTSSGKINRRLLPAPDSKAMMLSDAYVAPRDQLEEELAVLWSEVLGVPRVGVHDNFFTLGGHSLLAAQLVVRIAQTLHVEVPLRAMFEGPTMGELSASMLALRASGVSLGRSLLRARDRSSDTGWPLSFGQQRLWFLEQMEGELTAYNMPFAWRLVGALDVEALQAALGSIVDRHEVLRTRYEVLEGEPVQVIGKVEAFDLEVEDLEGLDSEAQAGVLEARSREQSRRAFDLSRDLMLRASLARLSASEHVLLLTMHHIASDGWSLGVLWRELSLLYAAHSEGVSANLPALPVQYADYALWQREELQGERLEVLLAYWRAQLDSLAPLELPTDRARPAVMTYEGGRYEMELPAGLVAGLKSLAQSEQVTLYMLLLAAFQTLLSRYTAQEDIAVGTPTAGRHEAHLEGLLGFFVNTLVLRTDVSGDPTFRTLLDRVREVCLSAYDHQDLPFERLVEAVKPDRDLSRSPLVQVMFQLLGFDESPLSLGDVAVEALPSSGEQVRSDLEVHLRQHGGSVRGVVAYRTDLFDASTIERMVGHFVMLLEGIVAGADQKLSALPLLVEAEREQLLVQWNDTSVAYPDDKCVHQLFEAQVERTPEAIALVFGEEELTYGALNARSNQLAHYLQARGVGPETLVGVCLERSMDMVIGLLAILKAGSAYVPLDRANPSQRLAAHVADASLKVVLSTSDVDTSWAAQALRRIDLDVESHAIAASSRDNPMPIGNGKSLAYVMYTSGSTGTPKGVEVLHESINRLVINTDYVDLTSEDCIAHSSAVAFDAATFEIWGALLNGAKLAISSRDTAISTTEYALFLARHRVTTVFMTTALFNQHVVAQPDIFAGVKQVLFGGEMVDVPIIRKVLASTPPERLLHVYGPTEGTTFTSWFLVKAVGSENGTIPIGRPIANTQVYVLDAHRQPVPVGVAGELYIGGAGLARGYLNHAKLTAEKFVPHPFSNEVGARLYRTGDVCRWLADGNLEFMGRLDEQVKLRGYRIELGEIESVLKEHVDVLHCVVMLREDRPGDKRLVAYCVMRSGASLDPVSLRHHAHERLPDYMIPSAFVSLEALPLTGSGKINRRKLPEPGRSVFLETNKVIPRYQLEYKLASIWNELLDIENVGIHDNFFHLGGHSLQVAHMVLMIEQRIRVSLPMTLVFKYPTIAELSDHIETVAPSESLLAPLVLKPEGFKTPLIIIPGPDGTASNFLKTIPHGDSDRKVISIELNGRSQPWEMGDSLATIAQLYVEQIEALQADAPFHLIGHCAGGNLAFEVARQLHAKGRRVGTVTVLDSTPGVMPRLKWWRALTSLPSFISIVIWWLRDNRSKIGMNWFRKVAVRRKERSSKPRPSVIKLGNEENRPEWLHHRFGILANSNYNYKTGVLNGHVVIIRARGIMLNWSISPDYRWSEMVDGTCKVILQRGTHEGILKEPICRELAGHITKILDEADKRTHNVE